MPFRLLSEGREETFHLLDLSDVDPCPDLQAELTQVGDHLERTTHRVGGCGPVRRASAAW